MKKNYTAKRLNINGIVQGVGFRPFIFQLAALYHLHGMVANTPTGVSVHVEGETVNIDAFLNGIDTNAPPLAQITELSAQSIPKMGYQSFSISKSRRDSQVSTMISPDMSICDDCLKELTDPDNRRFGYPFINCTNCGPRYTIIDDIPYDRPKTSMKNFTMCDQCQTEYDDPNNRRFHAQPNACADCGPRITLHNNIRQKISTNDPVEKTVSLLKSGHIIAIKGLGGFHLAVDAQNSEAVARLRERKHRREKPLALMSANVEQIRQFARFNKADMELLSSPRRPIVLLQKKLSNPIADNVSPQNSYFGVMLPYTPLHYLLMNFGFAALVMTSGNLSEEPISIDNTDALDRLGKIADYFLMHDRDIYLRSDDSIVRHAAGGIRFIRRSRGYVPAPVVLKQALPQILACGGGMKNTVCLTKKNHAFLSQHIGDLETPSAYDFFEQTIDRLKRILNITPVVIAHDLHPDYFSTQYAMRYAADHPAITRIPVQHHHAHIVSCMAENKITEDVIGLSFDGTGYGSDGNIWGGEVLIANAVGFKRAAHLSYSPMPGGASAVKEPWRMAISYLFHAFGDQLWELDLPLINQMDTARIRMMIQMISKQINSPLTSSLGRLFGGVAAIMGVRSHVNFEGQAAMALEMLAGQDAMNARETGIYNLEWTPGETKKISIDPLISGIVTDMTNSMPLSRISAKFHLTIIDRFSDLCNELRKESKINCVALSGGGFQNSILLNGFTQKLTASGFKVISHTQVPANDGGLSLGQAFAAASMTRHL